MSIIEKVKELSCLIGDDPFQDNKLTVTIFDAVLKDTKEKERAQIYRRAKIIELEKRYVSQKPPLPPYILPVPFPSYPTKEKSKIPQKIPEKRAPAKKQKVPVTPKVSAASQRIHSSPPPPYSKVHVQPRRIHNHSHSTSKNN